MGVLLEVASSEASLSPESRYLPRRLDKATENSWIEQQQQQQQNHIILNHSDQSQQTQEESKKLQQQHDKSQQHLMPSTSGTTIITTTNTIKLQQQSQQKILLEPPIRLDQRRPSTGLSGRCADCGKKREDAVSYTIEDLDAVDGIPLESNFPGQVCTCDTTIITSTSSSPRQCSITTSRSHHDLRKFCSVETRWPGNYLTPDDNNGFYDLKIANDTEYRWELHTSRTDVDLNQRTKCNCHDLSPGEKRHPDRSDLRKHHSAETDKWSLRPDHLTTPPYDLRKHLSDASGMARELGQPTSRTLQVPEVMPNPKPRCTCPKTKTSLLLSPSQSPSPSSSPPLLPLQRSTRTPTPTPTTPIPTPTTTSTAITTATVITTTTTTAITTNQIDNKRIQKFQDQENKINFSKSLTTDEQINTDKLIINNNNNKPELKKYASADTRAPLIKRERGRLVQQKAIVGTSKKWEPKDDDKKIQRSKWAGMTHFSLQSEKKDFKHIDNKSKSLKEKQRYSVRRSLSPDPDPRQILRLDSKIVKRLISPEIKITADAKWAPYEGYSPLPSMGIKKRETKKISEIKWTPYDGSASELSILEVPEDNDDIDDYHITPTCHPPPCAPKLNDNYDDDEEERERWRFLNQISPFPIYQGAWKDVSPDDTPSKLHKINNNNNNNNVYEPSIWTPMEPPPTPIKHRKPSQITYVPPVPVKITKESKKKKLKNKTDSIQIKDDFNKFNPPTVIIRSSSEEQKNRQRPLLTRSKAHLDIPRKGIDATKRSHSEEVPRYRTKESHHGPSRAKSEEAAGYPWCDDEVRQYVTTV